jgi:hypothetical protein
MLALADQGNLNTVMSLLTQQTQASIERVTLFSESRTVEMEGLVTAGL